MATGELLVAVYCVTNKLTAGISYLVISGVCYTTVKPLLRTTALKKRIITLYLILWCDRHLSTPSGGVVSHRWRHQSNMESSGL